MKLTPENQALIQSKLKIKACANCNSTKATLSDMTSDIISLESDSFDGQTKILRTAIVTCDDCGNVRFFNLGHLI